MPPRDSTYVSTRRLFLRLLGGVYFVAFASLATQIAGLAGERGILPAARFLEWAHSIYGAASYFQLPTIFWLDASDASLRLAAWGGAVLAILLVLGIAPLLMLPLLWALYLSLTVAGQDFLSFQWDALLLEAGLLAMLWAPATWRLGRLERQPSEPARFLLVLLLFKLMFLSGATKLLSDDPTWRHASALDFHFETQPLPPWTAWYAHHLPAGVHQALVLFTFAVELGAPWFLLLPNRLRPLRLGAVAAIALLQLGIAATGNYGFFNALAIVLCVPLLDDATLARLRLGRAAGEPEAESPTRRAAVRVAVPLLLMLSGLSFVREIAYTLPGGRGIGWWPRWGNQVLGLVAPFRSINGYGLFRVMTTDRPELILEGSLDGTRWRSFEFRYKPGAVDRRPRFVAPFHPRLDWQLWFAALDPMGSLGWLEALADRLRTGTPEVLALLAENPFPETPPKFVRAVLYDYRFSTAEERRRTRAWWVREPEGVIPFSAQTQRVGEALDSLGITRALFVAQSTGASIALRLAIARPSLVRGLLSIDGGPAETAATPGMRKAFRLGGFVAKLAMDESKLRHSVRREIVRNSGDTTWITDVVIREYTAGQTTAPVGSVRAIIACRLQPVRVSLTLYPGALAQPNPT